MIDLIPGPHLRSDLHECAGRLNAQRVSWDGNPLGLCLTVPKQKQGLAWVVPDQIST